MPQVNREPLEISEAQYRTAKQPVQNRYIRLEILNDKFEELWSIEGATLTGSININAQSNIRRNASLEVVAVDSRLDTKPGNAIWMDRYIRLWVGIEDLRPQTHADSIVWNNCGIFIIDAPNYHYDPNTNTLNISLMDMMCKLTGVRNGYLSGTGVVYKAGESIKTAIEDTLTQFTSITNYSISDPPYPGVIPNDLEFGQGATVYDVLNALAEIYPDYEIFFDVNGVFVYQKIPTGLDETGEQEKPLIQDDTWDFVVLSEEINTSFQDVKNSIEVFGRTHNPQYYDDAPEIVYNTVPTIVTKATIIGTGDSSERPEIPPGENEDDTPAIRLPSNSFIGLTIPDVVTYSVGQIYGFTLTVEAGKPLINPQLQINTLGSYFIEADNGGDLIIPDNGEKTYYVIEYVEESTERKYFRWLGHLQAYGFAEDTNPNSPFNVSDPPNGIGRIHLPLFDGDYANCITDELAQQRAEYELWLHTNMNNRVQLNIIPIYWLDVNILVSYTVKRTQETHDYLIKSIQLGLGPTDQGSLEMIQFYPRPETESET